MRHCFILWAAARYEFVVLYFCWYDIVSKERGCDGWGTVHYFPQSVRIRAIMSSWIKPTPSSAPLLLRRTRPPRTWTVPCCFAWTCLRNSVTLRSVTPSVTSSETTATLPPSWCDSRGSVHHSPHWPHHRLFYSQVKRPHLSCVRSKPRWMMLSATMLTGSLPTLV